MQSVQLQTLLETAIFNRRMSKNDIKKLNLLQIIEFVNINSSKISLKQKSYILQSLTNLLLKMFSNLIVEITEYKTETFYSQPSEKSHRKIGQPRKRRKKVNYMEKPLAELEKEADSIIESQLSSNRNMAELNDITLKRQGIQKDITLKPMEDSLLPNNINFKQVLEDTLLKNGFGNDEMRQDFLPIEQVPDKTTDKKYSFLETMKKSQEIQEQRLARNYKDLMVSTLELEEARNTTIRKTRKKTVRKSHYLRRDENIDVDRSILDVTALNQLRQDIKQTKRKQQDSMVASQIEIVAPELAEFARSFHKDQNLKDKLLDFQKYLQLNSTLNNTLMNRVEMARFGSKDKSMEQIWNLQRSSRFKSSQSQKSSSLGDYDQVHDLPNPLSIINEITGVNQTTNQNSRTPIKTLNKLSDSQQRIASILSSQMHEGKLNFNSFVHSQKMSHKAKSTLFYELMGLNFGLVQTEPAKFGDIIIVRA